MCLGCLVDCDYYYFDQCRVIALLESLFFSLSLSLSREGDGGRWCEIMNFGELQTIWLHFPHSIEFKINALTATTTFISFFQCIGIAY